MKNILFILLGFSIIFLPSCEEIPPDVSNMTGGMDTGGGDVENQMRHVLVEEFTGVKCINCPGGSEALEDLLDAHGVQLVAVSIHSGFFSTPYPQNLYDFQTADGDNILNYLGQPLGYPTAVVNRQLFTGEDDLQLDQSSWAGRIAEVLQDSPEVKLDLQLDYDASSRNVDINVDIHVVETLTADVPRISIMITENNIVDHQLTPESSPDTDPDYVHKHVFRDMITNFDGNAISAPLTVGSVVSESFSYTVPSNWKAEDCSIIALVHNNGSTKDILQVVEKHLVE